MTAIDINIDFPGKWDDLSNKELKRLSQGIFRGDNSFEFALRIIKGRLSRKEYKQLKSVHPTALSEGLTHHLKKFFEEPSLTRMPVDWLGRKDSFMDVTTGEYEKVVEALNEKKGYMEVIEILFPEEVKDIQKKEWLPMLLMVWVTSCLSLLDKTFYELKEGGSEGVGDLGFTDLIHAGAGERNGTRGQIRATPIWEFLYDMLLQKRMADEIKRKSK